MDDDLFVTRPGHGDGQSSIPVPCTPSISKIPQPHIRGLNTVQHSPLGKRNSGSNGDVLIEIGPEVNNMPPPPKLQSYQAGLRRSTSVNYAMSSSLGIRPKNAGMDGTGDRRAMLEASIRPTAITGTVRKPQPPTITNSSAIPGFRAKSENSMRAAARLPPPKMQQQPARPQSAQGETPSARILKVNQNLSNPPWDVKGRLDEMESKYHELMDRLESGKLVSGTQMDQLQGQVTTLTSEKAAWELQRRQLQDEISTLQSQIFTARNDLMDEQRRSRIDKEDTERALKRELEAATYGMKNRENELQQDYQRQLETSLQACRSELDFQHRQKYEALSQEMHALQVKTESERSSLKLEIQTKEATLLQQYNSREAKLRQELAELQNSLLQMQVDTTESQRRAESDVADLRAKISAMQLELEDKDRCIALLKNTIAEQQSNRSSMELASTSMQSRLYALEVELNNRDKVIAEMKKASDDAQIGYYNMKERLEKEETLRRSLHNQVQELKGNIRVFCRLRPPSAAEIANVADIRFPDGDLERREIELTGPSTESALGMAMGTNMTKTQAFEFDRVFSASATNDDVFKEISELVQSALDGFNVCIFCYGQTGSGKTYTMSSPDGIISRAVDQIFATCERLREQYWEFTCEGQFLEIYNETIQDLLVETDELGKKKYEIRNDTKENKITIPDLLSVELSSRALANEMLHKASRNRSVVATKANERSSRSHSVFILRLTGFNTKTKDRREGTLNLIDLAGSERLSHSQATGDRLKETVSINKSLSSLRDVITALGSGKEGGHIPYRNSKLTYLLQYSLGGNSKTLMFVNISPSKEHVSESINSLRFATKVNNTHIGTARKN
ncbi:P-loop containing nucleoside triphosphate hydrolase protein [Limtongia smithiae]|uniref:P-loop containing nucleoside triphosphate hydrolase protein n=1 Tax=Limtongia smithiae TaxID=1125753 RepID=UPI0034CE492E